MGYLLLVGLAVLAYVYRDTVKEYWNKLVDKISG